MFELSWFEASRCALSAVLLDNVNAAETQLAKLVDGIGIGIGQQLGAILRNGSAGPVGTSRNHFDALRGRAVNKIATTGTHHTVADRFGAIGTQGKHATCIILPKEIGRHHRQSSIAGLYLAVIAFDIS